MTTAQDTTLTQVMAQVQPQHRRQRLRRGRPGRSELPDPRFKEP